MDGRGSELSFPEERALFFLLAYWSLENARGVEEVKRNAALHAHRFPVIGSYSSAILRWSRNFSMRPGSRP